MARRGRKERSKVKPEMGRRGRKKREVREEDEEDAEFALTSLEAEHDSVEPVDEDEDADLGPQWSQGRPTQPDDKGKEEADDDPEPGRRSKRIRERKQLSGYVHHPEEIEDILVESSDVDEGPQQDEPRTETVTLDQITQAATINIAYLNALVGVVSYYQNSGRPNVERSIREIEADIESTLHALRDSPLPITQVGPIEHAVPPTIPAADGTEMRFTHIAQSLGIIWRDVPEEKKQEVYDRALFLHHECFGCAPVRKLMYTSTGRRAVYYYNETTYRPTMYKALIEFKKREANGSVSLSPQ